MINVKVVSLKAPNSIVFLNETIDEASIGPSEIICETLVSAISPGTELAAYNGPSSETVYWLSSIVRILQCE